MGLNWADLHVLLHPILLSLNLFNFSLSKGLTCIGSVLACCSTRAKSGAQNRMFFA
jgi:hypothetical protein